MDVFKLTFETVIVGLFALPWLWVVFDLTQPDLLTGSSISRLIAPIPAEMRPHAVGLAFLPLAYLLGLMITPIASEFWNDPDMLGAVLTTEETIQASTYLKVGAPPIPGLDTTAILKPASFRSGDAESPLDEEYRARNLEKFQHEFSHEESTLLLRGSEGNGGVSRLHERLSVLRGATFSAFALTLLCGFAWCGRGGKDPNAPGGRSLWRQVRRPVGFLLPLVLIGLAAKALFDYSHQRRAGDLPVAELVFVALGAFGLFVAIGGTRSRLHFHGLGFAFALCFALLSYAGYTSTEKSYAEEIFNNYQALQPANATVGSHNVALNMLTAASGE